ncbi:MAG: hypothetical protein MK096_09665 [Oleiphilaceae bacterium]|nr:hypothetical protein [Oleiphilaceae bacterium]
MLQTLVSIAIGFWMLPFLYNNLGAEQYGVWVLLGSTVAAFYMLDLGFSQAITRYVAEYIYTERFQEANKIINTALAIYSLLGLIILLAAVLVARFFFNESELNSISDNAPQIAFFILALSLALEFPAKAFPGIINAYLRFDRVAQVRTAFSIINAIAIYLFVSEGYGIVAIAIIGLTTNSLSTLIYALFAKSLFKQLLFSRELINKEDFVEIYHFSKWVFIIDTAYLLKDKIGIWAIAAFGMIASLPIFYAAQRLAEYAGTFINQALAMSTPLLTKYHSEGDIEKLRETHSLFFKMYVIASVTTMGGFILAGEAFLKVWMGPDFDAKLSAEILFVLATSSFIMISLQPFVSLLMTLKKHKYAAIISMLELSASTASILVFKDDFGLVGIATACLLTMAIVRLTLLPIATAQAADKSILTPLVWSGLYVAITLLLLYSTKLFISVSNTWLAILTNASLALPLALVPAFMLFNANERKVISRAISQLSKRLSQR